MIAVANRIFVNPDYAEAFEARFRERAGLVDEMPGFIFNQVLRPSQPGRPLYRDDLLGITRAV